MSKFMRVMLSMLLLVMPIVGALSLAVAEAPITIRYAAWNVATEDDGESLERAMVAEYMENHPGVMI